MSKQGSFGFGGGQRSYSFACFHADRIPNNIIAERCPSVKCEWIMFQNDPDSSDNLFVGGNRLPVVGNGVELEPGKTTGWIPLNNLNLVIHKEADATTWLNYMMIGCDSRTMTPDLLFSHLLLEDRGHLLQEDGCRIRL